MMPGYSATPSASACRLRASPRWPGRRTASTPGTGGVSRQVARQPAGFPAEGVGPAERRRVDHLDEHRRAPPGRRLGPPEPAQPLRECLDHEGQPVALVPVVRPADRQQRAGRVGEQRRWVVGRQARRVERPQSGEPLPLAAQPVRHPVGGDRRADVDQDRVAVGRDADRERVRGEDRLPPAERGDLATAGSELAT